MSFLRAQLDADPKGTMISIKRFLEQRRNPNPPPGDGPGGEILQASLQMGRLLVDAVAAHMIRGREADFKAFNRTMKALAQKMDKPPSPLSLLELSSEAVEALETYAERTTDYLREISEHMQSMVAMLTQTLSDVAGQSDASVARLQAIEQQIEHASGLEDVRALRASLENCLGAVREAATQQRKGSTATLDRLREKIDVTQHRIDLERSQSSSGTHSRDAEIELAPEESDAIEVSATSYVGVFKLQRADHIGTRFGEVAKSQMLSAISQSLKKVLGANDRLLRWKGTSFVMFLNSTATINEVRVSLAEAVARTGQHYIEVGKKSALLSVGIDWIVFPQAQCPSLDAVFTEVDSFLAAETLSNTPYERHALASRGA
jgi:GGDEF domain-containing protein